MADQKKCLSVVIPAYNEEKNIEETFKVITDLLKSENIEHEIIFVDDGSRDKTWEIISGLSEKGDKLVGVHFSRNFGKDSAMFAGLENAKGDCCVVIDCDLQHPPEKIIEMYRLWEAGYEVVEGVKEDRGEESAMRRFAVKRFYSILSKATDQDMEDTSDFKLLDRKVVDTLNSLPERNVFFRALSFWVGFKRTTVSYKVRTRNSGESKWSLKSLIRYAVRNIGSFSSAPIHAVTVLGFIMLIVSVVIGIITIIHKIIGSAVDGFTTVIILILFAGSIIMIAQGIIGYYVARIYDEVKGRPRYIISEVCGRKEDRS